MKAYKALFHHIYIINQLSLPYTQNAIHKKKTKKKQICITLNKSITNKTYIKSFEP